MTPPAPASLAAASSAVLRASLETGLQQGHVWPAFQPIIRLACGSVSGFEVLARWHDPVWGDISPAEFIPCLERHGLIDLLFTGLLQRACTQARQWPHNFSLAFNVSPLQLEQADFAQKLVRTVTATGFPLKRVELEVTESSLISDDEQAYALLREVNDHGVGIAIDDFGTGFSSLARLESFPFQKLKIDARFVRNLDTESSKRRIAAAIIGLGQSLGITVVAEGIETVAEEAILRELGCDLGQGWLYGKADRAEQGAAQLERRGGLAAGLCPLDDSPFQQLHQLSNLYEQVPVGICFIDKSYRHVRANSRFARIYGLTRNALIGQPLSEVLAQPQLGDFLSALNATALTGEPVMRDEKMQGMDIRLLFSRVLDVGKELLGFSIVASDRTEENTLQASLQSSEQRLRAERDFAEAIIRSMPETFFYYDENLKLRRWNQRHEQVSGYTADELAGSSPLQFLPPEQHEKAQQAIHEVQTTGHTSLEASLVCKDGRQLRYSFNASAFIHEGRFGMIGTGLNVSRLHDLETSLSRGHLILDAVARATDVGLMCIDKTGRLLFWHQPPGVSWAVPAKVEATRDGHALLAFIAQQALEPGDLLSGMSMQAELVGAQRLASIAMCDGNMLDCCVAPLKDACGGTLGQVWIFSQAHASETA